MRTTLERGTYVTSIGCMECTLQVATLNDIIGYAIAHRYFRGFRSAALQLGFFGGTLRRHLCELEIDLSERWKFAANLNWNLQFFIHKDVDVAFEPKKAEFVLVSRS